MPAGPAARAGVRQGDVLLAIDGKLLHIDEIHRLLPTKQKRTHFMHRAFSKALFTTSQSPNRVQKLAILRLIVLLISVALRLSLRAVFIVGVGKVISIWAVPLKAQLWEQGVDASGPGTTQPRVVAVANQQ